MQEFPNRVDFIHIHFCLVVKQNGVVCACSKYGQCCWNGGKACEKCENLPRAFSRLECFDRSSIFHPHGIEICRYDEESDYGEWIIQYDILPECTLNPSINMKAEVSIEQVFPEVPAISVRIVDQTGTAEQVAMKIQEFYRIRKDNMDPESLLWNRPWYNRDNFVNCPYY